MTSSTWLRFHHPRRETGLTLVCLPHAGGGPSAFREWPSYARHTDIVSAHLPGREGRLGEPALTEIEPVLDGLDRALHTIQGDFALFGHSMGALLGFELARRAAARGDRRLQALVVAGCPAPQTRRSQPVHALPDGELIGELARLGGVRQEALDFPELMSLMLPTLRADLAIVDNYRCVDAMPLPYPISVHCGDHDPDFGPGQAHEWQRHTAAGFQITVHAGGHFFPVHRPAPVVAGIEHALLAPAGDAR